MEFAAQQCAMPRYNERQGIGLELKYSKKYYGLLFSETPCKLHYQEITQTLPCYQGRLTVDRSIWIDPLVRAMWIDPPLDALHGALHKKHLLTSNKSNIFHIVYIYNCILITFSAILINNNNNAM